jgi:peptidoglycan/xylan/chitin deacetylase (PgdA/CDA1 family)
MSTQSLILTFHGIGAPPADAGESERSVWVSPELFEATLDEAARRRDVVITFDDGNRSDVEVALPALRRRGTTATFFVLAGRLDQPGFLTSAEVRELADSGMTVGSHGLEHRSWRSLGDEELVSQLERARSLLERVVACPVTEASCPFGEYDRRVLRHLRRLGHERVYTSDGGRTRARGWLLARNTVTSGWDPQVGLDGRDPAHARAVRGVKRLAKRWR